jgi:hypothetical protein
MGVFKKLTRITGAVSIFQLHFTSLSFLSNVESIGECDEDPSTPSPTCDGVMWQDGNYGLKIRENAFLTSLSLTSLRRIGGPGDNGPVAPVYIKDNLALCLVDTINWKDITFADEPTGRIDGECGTSNFLSTPCQLGFTVEFLRSPRILLSIEAYSSAVQNTFKTSPVNPVICEAEKPCASDCGDRGCWDFSSAGCQRCSSTSDVLQDGVCKSTRCSAGYFNFAGGICVACDPTCAACSAGSCNDCTKCAAGHLLRGNKCVPSCCKAEIASCLACAAGVSVSSFCELTRDPVVGCPQKENQECGYGYKDGLPVGFLGDCVDGLHCKCVGACAISTCVPKTCVATDDPDSTIKHEIHCANGLLASGTMPNCACTPDEPIYPSLIANSAVHMSTLSALPLTCLVYFIA